MGVRLTHRGRRRAGRRRVEAAFGPVDPATRRRVERAVLRGQPVVNRALAPLARWLIAYHRARAVVPSTVGRTPLAVGLAAAVPAVVFAVAGRWLLAAVMAALSASQAGLLWSTGPGVRRRLARLDRAEAALPPDPGR